MKATEQELLENLFDALDRMFDHESAVIDMHAILFATNAALANSSLPIQLSSYETQLRQVVRSGDDIEAQREKALEITNNLRETLDELLPF